MRLMVNGEEKHFSTEMSLADLVASYKLENKLVVTEVNGKVIDRTQWEDVRLQEGMSIELVHFVGGG